MHRSLQEEGRKVSRRSQREVQRTLNRIEATAREIGTSRWRKRPQESVPTLRTATDGTSGYVEISGRGAFFQEIGTSVHPPNPAMQPAIDAHAPDFYKRMERVVGEDL